MLEGLLIGLQTALSIQNLLMVIAGCLIGTFIGMLPGLGPMSIIAIMIPVAISMGDPSAALILLAGVYYGAIFGGSTSSILLNAPGVAGTVASSFDGYPMARKGQAGKALTIAAIASFAYARRHVVLDTNVRRVHTRVCGGEEFPSRTPTRAERDRAESLLPQDPATAATWAVAVMELGALICTANDPKCPDCPIATQCRWLALGRPAYAGPPRKGQTYDGTDRQCRGRLLAVLRDSDGPVHLSGFDSAWPTADQRARCLQSLLSDGLITRSGPSTYALP